MYDRFKYEIYHVHTNISTLPQEKKHSKTTIHTCMYMLCVKAERRGHFYQQSLVYTLNITGVMSTRKHFRHNYKSLGLQ